MLMDANGFALDALALDRGSVRTYDADGRLHVAATNISKSNICPYLGSEIPDFEALGLQPDRLYQLFRDPEELARAAPTFNNIPLLSRHVPVSADDHQPDLVVGSTGTDASFEAPFLKNSLVIWASAAIHAVRSDEKKELSCAYRYRADMTPGEYLGVKFDGIMRDIIGNHVAIVENGRAGADVVIGDSKEDLQTMTKTVLTRKAAMTHGALSAYLLPKLAQDQKIDVAKIVAGLDAKTFAAKKPGIVAALGEATKGKLAKDASIEDVAQLLDALECMPMAEAADELEPSSAVPAVKKPDEDDAKAKDEDPDDEDETEEERKKRLAAAKDKKAKDADPEPGEKDKEKKDMVTKSAMDEAIAKAVQVAADTATKTQREIRDAERAVRPYIGDLAIAHDSAESVYRTALTSLGLKVEGVHPSAFPALLQMVPVPGAKPKRETVAMDASATEGFAKRYPDAARITLI